MLSRLCRTISRVPRQDSDVQGTLENQTRNLNTVLDDNNYTLERISRVIRSYFFIAIETRKLKEYKIWGKDPVIKESVNKLAPLIKELDPESLHLLIVNLSMLNVLYPNVWKEIETKFLQESHEYLPTNQLVSIIEAFSVAGRKNTEIWSLLSKKVLSEIYSSGNLERKEFVKVFCGLVQSGVEMPELMPHLIDNFRSVTEEMTPTEYFNLLEAISKSSFRHVEIMTKVIEGCLEVVSNAQNKNYYRVLSCLIRIGHDQYIDQVEELLKANIENVLISSLSSLIISYSKPELINSQKRKNFVEYLLNYYKTNRDTLLKNFSKEVSTVYEMKFLIAATRYGIEIDDEKLLKVFNLSNSLNMENNFGFRALKVSAEEYLKSKNLI